MALRFFADHCVPASVQRALTENTHAVFRLRDHLPANAPDERVTTHAQVLGAVLLTLDGDFADIVAYPPERYGGIIALQVRGRPETVPALVDQLQSYLRAYPARARYTGKLLLVEPHRVRVR